MPKTIINESKGISYFQNTTFNIIGIIIPMAVGIIAVPLSIKGLGKENYGILSLCIALIGYFIVFDLGLARTTTKFCSLAFKNKEFELIPSIFWTSIFISILIGVILFIILGLFSPTLVFKILKIPVDMKHEMLKCLYLLAATLPFLIVSSSLKGFLYAIRRFDIDNIIQIPSSILNFMIPALSFFIPLKIVTIMGLLLLNRIITVLIYFFACYFVSTHIRKFEFSSIQLKKMLNYGVWVAVSNIISPAMLYLDRFVIGSFTSLQQVTYYTAPFDGVSKVRIFPGALMRTLFPEFSSINIVTEQDKSIELLRKSYKYCIVFVGFIITTMIFYSKIIIGLWLGNDFIIPCNDVFKFLCVGIFFNAVSLPPFNYLQGIGKTNLTAIIHLIETPIYIVIMILLIKNYGINGAAAAWALRQLFDAIFLSLFIIKTDNKNIRALYNFEVISLFLWAVIFIFIFFFITINSNPFFVIWCSICLFLLLKFFTDVNERNLIRQIFRKYNFVKK